MKIIVFKFFCCYTGRLHILLLTCCYSLKFEQVYLSAMSIFRYPQTDSFWYTYFHRPINKCSWWIRPTYYHQCIEKRLGAFMIYMVENLVTYNSILFSCYIHIYIVVINLLYPHFYKRISIHSTVCIFSLIIFLKYLWKVFTFL